MCIPVFGEIKYSLSGHLWQTHWCCCSSQRMAGNQSAGSQWLRLSTLIGLSVSSPELLPDWLNLDILALNRPAGQRIFQLLLDQSKFTLESAPILSTYFTFSNPSLRGFAASVLSMVYNWWKDDHIKTWVWSLKNVCISNPDRNNLMCKIRVLKPSTTKLGNNWNTANTPMQDTWRDF